MPQEIWKEFSTFQISNLGNVRKADGTPQPVSATGKYARLGRGYLAFRSDGKLIKVHRAVAFLFVQNPQSLPQINHKDTNTSNNAAVNLEWVTNSENLIHASKHGLLRPQHGEACVTHKLTRDAVEKIRAATAAGKTHREAAKLFGISKTQIGRITRKESWKNI